MNYLVIENSNAVAVLDDFCLSKKDIRLNTALREHYAARVITVKEHDIDINLEQKIEVSVEQKEGIWFSEIINLIPIVIYDKKELIKS